MIPPPNLDTSATFQDYVVPRMLEAGDCKPGTYLGTFDCLYTGDLAPDGFQALGIVSFVLSRSANSEVLVIEDGVIDGWGVMFFFAYLSGELSCATGEITGTIDDGFYNPLFKGCSGAMGDMPGVNCIITDRSDPDYVAWTPNLEGVYTGTLEPATETISGDWTFTPLDIGGACEGSFSVMRVP